MLLLLFDLTDYNLKKSPFPQTVQKIPVFDPNNLFFPSPWKYLYVVSLPVTSDLRKAGPRSTSLPFHNIQIFISDFAFVPLRSRFIWIQAWLHTCFTMEYVNQHTQNWTWTASKNHSKPEPQIRGAHSRRHGESSSYHIDLTTSPTNPRVESEREHKSVQSSKGHCSSCCHPAEYSCC